MDDITNYKLFLGYHITRNNNLDGLNKGLILEENEHCDLIKYLYFKIFENELNDDDSNKLNPYDLNEEFEEYGYHFTNVSNKYILDFKTNKSKYLCGKFIYLVYGNGSELILNNPEENSCKIIVSKNNLLFKKIKIQKRNSIIYKIKRFINKIIW
jgi:hypothetical protein